MKNVFLGKIATFVTLVFICFNDITAKNLSNFNLK